MIVVLQVFHVLLQEVQHFGALTPICQLYRLAGCSPFCIQSTAWKAFEPFKTL